MGGRIFEGMHLQGSLHRSKLVGLLSDLTQVDVDASKQDVAERLGLWLDAFGTVRLDAALQSIASFAMQKTAAGQGATLLAAHEAMQKVRDEVSAHIASGGAMLANEALLADLGQMEHAGHAGNTGKAVVKYGPIHQRYLDQQRHMEAKIGPLRVQLRQVLSRVSTPLRQLATLDAVMEQMLGGREQKLWSTVPAYLERRFEHWRQVQPAEGWLVRFSQDFQQVLQAEWMVRLQPVIGLIEALSSEVRTHQ